MLVISHPTGNKNVRNAVEAFYKAGFLARFYTSISWDSETRLATILPASFKSTLNRRAFSGIPKNLIYAYPLLEMMRLLSIKLKLRNFIRHDHGPLSVYAVYKALDTHVAANLDNIDRIEKVYAFSVGALSTFTRAKQLALRTIYELPIGYWRYHRKIMEEEAALKPEWADTILSVRDTKEKLERMDNEIAMADKIIVPSRFVADSLLTMNQRVKEIAIVPYGGPEPLHEVRTFKGKNEKLRILFVGGLSQRKGISYLFDAANLLKDKVNLTVIGRRVAPCKALDDALNGCRYIATLPNSLVLQEMEQHDVLVFPTLFEGFALVILEAMSRGLPVITTSHSGAGPEIISDGEDGYIVPIRSTECIAERLEYLANNPDGLNKMKVAALEKAKRFPWKAYQSKLVQEVSN